MTGGPIDIRRREAVGVYGITNISGGVPAPSGCLVYAARRFWTSSGRSTKRAAPPSGELQTS